LLCTGGERILPETVEAARATGTTTVLWTIDSVKSRDPRVALAPYFDFVFCGGTEMIAALRGSKLHNGPYWLPFACDPEVHRPIRLSPEEKSRYDYDIVFVGSLHRDLYPNRLSMLEALADFKMGIWGPGARALPASSPVHGKIRGDGIGYEEWVRIYSSARIVLCAHSSYPDKPCAQASPRVYEVLACGGFLLCDNQSDVRTLFEDGQDLAIFRSLSDLKHKARYYLDHDQERGEIAAHGREKGFGKAYLPPPCRDTHYHSHRGEMTDPARVIHIVEDLGIVGLEKVVRNIVVTCDRARFHTRSLVHRKRQGNRRGNRGRWRQGSHLGHSPATLSGLPARSGWPAGFLRARALNRALPFLAELLTASHMRWLFCLAELSY